MSVLRERERGGREMENREREKGKVNFENFQEEEVNDERRSVAVAGWFQISSDGRGARGTLSGS